MNNCAAGLTITGNSTVQSALAAGSVVTGWTASEGLLHGDGAIDANTVDSRLDLKPGTYLIIFGATVEAPADSDDNTSGDAQGEVTFQVFKGGTGVTGAKAAINDGTIGEPNHVSIVIPVEITKANLDAGTNYVDVRATAADSSGNDILVSEARLFAVRLS
jgi:hypothetical protein